MCCLQAIYKTTFEKLKAQCNLQYVISKRVLSLSQMERWLRYFARDCGCLEKSENSQRENRLAELPRQTTNRGRKPSQTFLPADIHTRQGGYESFFREESFEYSILTGERGERDGRFAGARSNFISPISFFPAYYS